MSGFEAGVWNDSYNVGIDFIDDTHKKLFSVIHRMKELIDNNNQETSSYACIEMIKYFKSYTLKHFAEEEEYMRSIEYEDYEYHKSLHDNLRGVVLPSLEKQLADSNYSFENVQKFLGICLGWLSGHIITEDRKISKNSPVTLSDCSENEGIKMLQEVVIQMVQEMFNLSSSLVEEHYTGKYKMGDTVNYELTYSTDSNKSIKVTILLEEQLVLKTVGQMPGANFYEIDEVVLSATKELAKIIMQRVRLMFKKQGIHYEFNDDRLITTKELKKIMKKTPPLYSLVFNTEFGNLIFCISAQ